MNPLSLFLILTILSIQLLSSDATKKIETKIIKKKKQLEAKKSQKSKTKIKIKLLAKEIKEQSLSLNLLEKEIIDVNSDIEANMDKLKSSKLELETLERDTKLTIKEKSNNEEQIINTIIDEFISSLALELASKESLDKLIDSHIYNILSLNSKEEIIKLDSKQIVLAQKSKQNKQKILALKKYIKIAQYKKNRLKKLLKEQNLALANLEKKHNTYQKELKKIANKQESLKNLLANLNILKKEEIKKEKIRKAKKRKELQEKRKKQKLAALEKKEKTGIIKKKADTVAKDVDIDIRMLGSSVKGVKITKYTGRKTIAPLKSYKIVKEFGKYFDPVYKIKLFNESILLKSKKPNAKVYNILNGKIVYAKKNSGMLENVVIVKHSNNLHTIYSHLDRISPTLRVGKWIQKGYVVGRVNDTLNFQATKNNYHINPRDLF